MLIVVIIIASLMTMQGNKYTQYVRLCLLRGDIRASKIPVAKTNITTTSLVRQ